MKQTAPYGSWKSPITSDLIVAETIGLEQVVVDGDDVYWIETRPSEQGRHVIVCRGPDGNAKDVTPESFNARTRVHEYGGGAYTVHNGVVYASNFADQRVYAIRDGEDPQPITPDRDYRFADGCFDIARQWLVCVREDHTTSDTEPINEIVAVDVNGNEKIQVLASGRDFYSNPRLSPDGSRLAWLAWDHPNMPWDGTELFIGDLHVDGALTNIRRIAGGSEESIFQPEWSPAGDLVFVSDRTGWWNLYRWGGDQTDPLAVMDAEFGRPSWLFAWSTYAFLDESRILCSYTQNGTWSLAIVDTDSGQLESLETPFSDLRFVTSAKGKGYFVAGSSRMGAAVVEFDAAIKQITTLKASSKISVDDGYLSTPETIAFPSANGRTSHGFYYPPTNKDFDAPTGDLPPLLVCSHGGPTSATSTILRLEIQYWTSRGFALLDVNYGGSTGYGREYRQLLQNAWGIVDVEDCSSGALYLAQQQKADPKRLGIRGGSAGGFTTLAALTFTDVFHAGADYYGVSDLEALAKETHKFESRYLDGLIGPYPAEAALYRERSPIYSVERLSCPLIVFQGLEDKVVPPNQAEMIVNALRGKGVPVAYVPFEGEQHGFRQAANIKRALDGELYFYGRVFGFEPADELEPVEIENL